MHKIKTSIAAMTVVGLASFGLIQVAEATGGGDHKFKICHNGHTISVDEHAWKAHKKHGDTKGECSTPDPDPTTSTPDPDPTTSSPEPDPDPTTSTPDPDPTTSTPDPDPTTTAPDPDPTTAPPVVTPEKPSKPQRDVERKATGKHKPRAGVSTKYDRDGDKVVDQFYAPSGQPVSETG